MSLRYSAENALMFVDYLWICLWYYHGRFVNPNSIEDIGPFLRRMGEHVVDVSDVSTGECTLLSGNRGHIRLDSPGRHISASQPSNSSSPPSCPVLSRTDSPSLPSTTPLSRTFATAYTRGMPPLSSPSSFTIPVSSDYPGSSKTSVN